MADWSYIAHGVLTGDWGRAGYEGDQVAKIQPTLERALHVLHQAASDENHPLARLDGFGPSQAAIGLYAETVAVGAFARIKHGEEEMSTDDLAMFARSYLAVANSFWNGAP
ncbi:hypothetical protein [Streptomyces sp. A1547]|uniref:hypothetical protein n=1 Tax=Streptomyces sp. A1547 TaxID=2563105 RepID=UPI00109EA7CF|nr:hypothetical protein [Streptomyces sp. A1547]THA41799.1 hypothetical protein E6W17_02615 [Streptomyces sp. A1547]